MTEKPNPQQRMIDISLQHHKEKGLLRGIQLVIFDVDHTLAIPRDNSFFDQYSKLIPQAVASLLAINPERAVEITNFFRTKYGGGEQVLFSGKLAQHYPEFEIITPDYATLHDHFLTANPEGNFDANPAIVELVSAVRKNGIKAAALTSSPSAISRKILSLTGFNVDEHFDHFQGYERDSGPPKKILRERAFLNIAEKFNLAPEEVLSIGDSYKDDIFPALSAGMSTCLITTNPPKEYEGIYAPSVIDAFSN